MTNCNVTLALAFGPSEPYVSDDMKVATAVEYTDGTYRVTTAYARIPLTNPPKVVPFPQGGVFSFVQPNGRQKFLLIPNTASVNYADLVEVVPTVETPGYLGDTVMTGVLEDVDSHFREEIDAIFAATAEGDVTDAAVGAIINNGADTKDALGDEFADDTSPLGLAAAGRIQAAIDAVTTSDIIATSTAGALTRGKWTRVNATAGTKAMTLANATAARQVTIVEKSDSSANAVTVALGLRGSAGSLTLDSQFQTFVLVADDDLNWYVQSTHRTKASFDAAYAAKSRLPYSAADYAVGDGTTNDTAGIQAGLNAAAAAGVAFEFVRGKTYKIVQPSSSSTEAVLVPSNSKIIGNGATILISGVDGTKTFYNQTPNTLSLPGHAGLFNGFGTSTTAHNISIRDLTFKGENNPFAWVFGHQCAAVDVSIPATAGAVHDIVVEGCTFTNLYGFAIHQQGGALRFHNRNNFITMCGSTINNNANESEITGNVFDNTGGIESSSSHGVIADNIMTNILTGSAISAGGRVTGAYGFGTVIRGNTIDKVDGAGISVADGSDGPLIYGNTIRRTAKPGIQLVGGTTNQVRRAIVANNNLSSIGLISTAIPGDYIGVYVGANCQEISVIGNRVEEGSDALYSTKTAFAGEACDKLLMVGNAASGIQSGSNDLSLNNCTNAKVGPNDFAFNKIGITGTTTISSMPVGDLVWVKGGNGEGVRFSTVLPEGAVSAPPGTICVVAYNASGFSTNQTGFTFWFKETGFSNSGWVPIGGSAKFVNKTANYTIVMSDRVVIFNGTSLTASLPDPTTTGLVGRKYVVKNINASALTVASLGTSKTIDGAASASLAQWARAEYLCDGTQWLSI